MSVIGHSASFCINAHPGRPRLMALGPTAMNEESVRIGDFESSRRFRSALPISVWRRVIRRELARRLLAALVFRWCRPGDACHAAVFLYFWPGNMISRYVAFSGP
ncbi:hypothetical protein L209DRAFT_747170 [Thermothelomyces heterothallicus CBS 203.75]